MLSIGSRDGVGERRELGLGFGFGFRRSREEEGGGGAMEENEIEEGEAFGDDYDEDDASINPDIALSYIDEKLQDVLGHLRKDFEGGVSAENLGAKFGGYGSFLPSYQRSPSILAQPKSPPRPANTAISKSPYNLSVESVQPNPLASRSISAPKNNTASDAQPSFSGRKENCVGNSLNGGSSISQPDSNNKPVNNSDQKSLKVRIKVGPDNSLVRRNMAAIYSGLGLDASPSSSPNDSPDASAGLSLEFRDNPGDSPLAILRVMTSFSVPGGHLHSPLHENLVQLAENKPPFIRKSGILNKGVPEIDMSLPATDNKANVDKEIKFDENSVRSIKEENLNGISGTTKMLKKEVDIHTPASKKITSNAFQSCLRTGDSKVERKIISDSTKGADKIIGISKESNSSSGKDKVSLPSSVKDEQCVSMGNLRIGAINNLGDANIQPKLKLNPKASLWESELDGKNPCNHRDTSSDIRRKGKSKNQKNHDTSKMNCAEHNGQNDLAEPIEQMPLQNVHSLGYESDKILQGNDQGYQGRRRKKGSHNISTLSVESTQEKFRAPTSVMTKEKKKSSHARGEHSGKRSKMLKSHKEANKPHSRESNRDFEVNVNADRMQNRAELAAPFMFADKPVERPGFKKDLNLHFDPMVNPPILASSACDAPITDAAVALDAPPAEVINENWVQCDICQKWRLLAPGTDPETLPKKWKCSMQVWLPGLNNCDVSEDENSTAFRAMYLVPVLVPEIGANVYGHHDVAPSSIASTNAQFLEQRLDHNMQSMPISAKKKSGRIDASSMPKTSVSKKNLQASVSNSNKQASVKNRSLNDVKEEPLETNSSVKGSFGSISKSQDLTTQKQNHRQKYEIPGRYSDGGYFTGKDGKLSKSKSKREVSQDGYRTSKKIKKEESDFLVENRVADLDMANKVAPDLDYCFPTKGTEKILQNHSDHSSSKDSKSDLGGKLSISTKKLKDPLRMYSNGVSDIDRSSTPNYAAKKRKVKEWQESHGHQDPVISSQNTLDNGLTVKEAFSESELREQKKVKVSKSERKESSMSIIDGNMGEKGRSTKILLSGSREQQSDGMNEEGRVAATSSSSKISSSRRSKTKLKDVRDSPVESVSSSPLRTCTTGNILIKRNSVANDDVVNVGHTFTCSPKRCSEGELGSDHSGTRRKEIGNSFQPKSLESYGAAEIQVSGGANKDRLYPERDAQVDLFAAEFDETNVGDIANKFDQGSKDFAKEAKKEIVDERDKSNNRLLPNGTIQLKSSKKLSIKERNRMSNSDADRAKLQINDNSTYQEELRDEHCNLEEKDEKYLGKKKSSAKSSSFDRTHNHLNNGSEERDLNPRVAYSGAGSKPNLQGKLQQPPSHPIENRVSSVANRIDRSDMISARGKSQSLQLSQDKSEALGTQRVPTPIKGSRSGVSPIDAVNGDASKIDEQLRKPDSQNAVNLNSLRQTPHNGPSSSPMRKDGPSIANAVLKEARNLKHTANRLKNEGLGHESINLYFEAALKYLHGASLLEPPISETAKHGEMNPSAHMLQMYADTAKLCKYCAQEYEKCKEMAAAALAYKCVEVAYMKVAYYKHPCASKDRHELQAALKTVLPGESPSSSASDVDNLNNQGAVDKAASTKAVASPQIAGNHVIAARNRPHFTRLLNYASDLNCAFDATKRSQNAIAAASGDLEKNVADSLFSVREVLDFNYNNVEGLLRLVRLAMESISP